MFLKRSPGTAATIYSSAFTTQDDKCILGDNHAQNTQERIFRLVSDQEIPSAFSETALGWLFPLRTHSLETDGNPVAVRMIWSARLFPVHWVKKQPVKRDSKEKTESLNSSWEWIRSSEFVLYYNGIHAPASGHFCAKMEINAVCCHRQMLIIICEITFANTRNFTR